MTDFWTYWRKRAKRRKRQITRNIKGLNKLKTLLYVGANNERLEMLDLFHHWGYEIDVLEVWEPNVKELIELNEEHHIFRNIYHDDILNLYQNFGIGPYDVVMFWHGPEHVEKEELPMLIKTLESLAIHYVIMAAPIGEYEQGPVDGNDHEVHKAYLYPKDFKKLKYRVSVLRRKKNKPRGSNMVIWRKMS